MSPETLTYNDLKPLAQAPPWVFSNRKLVGDDGAQVKIEGHGTFEGAREDLDHWQGSDGYSGRKPDPSKNAPLSTWKRDMERVYVTMPVTPDLQQHRTDGILGHDPKGSFDLEDEENPTAEEEERERIKDEWQEREDLIGKLRSFAGGISAEERTALRFRIGQGASEAATPEEVAKLIHIEHNRRDQCGVRREVESGKELGFFLWEQDNQRVCELTYLNEAGETVLEVKGKDGDDETDEGDPFTEDLGGKLLMHEGRGRLLIDEGVRNNQFALNTLRTWSLIVNEKTGFSERHFIDLMKPRDDKGNILEPERGPGRQQMHYSTPTLTLDKDGNEVERQTNPQIVDIDPGSTENLDDNAKMCKRALYEAARQMHRYMSGDAAASGESRIQARADFVQDLRGLKTSVDRAGKWVLETFWALCEVLSGQQVTGATASFDCILDAGPITAEERRALVEQVEAGALALFDALGIMGFDDPAGAIDRIREELEDPITQGQAKTKQIIESVEAGRFYRQQNGTAEGIEEQGNERGEGV